MPFSKRVSLLILIVGIVGIGVVFKYNKAFVWFWLNSLIRVVKILKATAVARVVAYLT